MSENHNVPNETFPITSNDSEHTSQGQHCLYIASALHMICMQPQCDGAADLIIKD